MHNRFGSHYGNVKDYRSLRLPKVLMNITYKRIGRMHRMIVCRIFLFPSEKKVPAAVPSDLKKNG